MAKAKPVKRHYCTLYKRSEQKDRRGQPDRTYDEVYLADVPCSIETLAGRELDLARTRYAQANYKITLWADPDHPLSVTHQLRLGGRTFEIGAINDPELLGLEVELLCSEVIQ
jgi:head-tail adaptor